jgi:ribosomal protein S12 methylthiotransferase
VDGEEMLGELLRASNGDCTFVSRQQDADVLIVNTCAFIQSAKEESIDAILHAVDLKNRGKVGKVVVTGCLAQRYSDELIKQIPEVDAFLGIESAEDVPNVVFGLTPSAKNLVNLPAERFPLVPPRRAAMGVSPWTAYLKLSEGCDHACSFCSIPSIRGRHRSKPMERVVAEARSLAGRGVKELILIAQDTTAYGIDIYRKMALPSLLEQLNDVSGIEWIRLLYCYPTMVTSSLVDAFCHLGKVIPYIDMPLQHADDAMLTLMRRGGGEARYRRLFAELRDRMPSICLRTTFIVGFPGETDAHFETLCQFTRDMRFDRVGVFAYSREEGTPSHDMPDQVPRHVATDRRDRLMQLQQEISHQAGLAQVGRDLDVIVEKSGGLSAVGRSYREAPEIDGVVRLHDVRSKPGEIARVTVTGADVYDLFAEPARSADTGITPELAGVR